MLLSSLYGCNSFIPFDTIVNATMAMAPVPLVKNPYEALVYAMFVVTIPFGLQMVLKMTYGAPDNTNPRKQNDMYAATKPVFGRLAVSSTRYSDNSELCELRQFCNKRS